MLLSIYLNVEFTLLLAWAIMLDAITTGFNALLWKPWLALLPMVSILAVFGLGAKMERELPKWLTNLLALPLVGLMVICWYIGATAIAAAMGSASFQDPQSLNATVLWGIEVASGAILVILIHGSFWRMELVSQRRNFA